MARPCTVCEHPDAKQINRDWVDSAAVSQSKAKRYRLIAQRYDLGHDAVKRHVNGHMTEGLNRAVALHAELVVETSKLDVMAALGRVTNRAEMMLEAAHEWLLDPDDPSKYDLNPRTHEVEIVYEEMVGKVAVRRTEKLAKLMRDVEEGLGITIVKAETKIADPRKLLLEAAAALKPILELIGKATGQIQLEDENRRLGREAQIILVILREFIAELGPEHVGRLETRLLAAKSEGR